MRTLPFIALLAFCLSSPVSAQSGGFALDRFLPAPTSEDGIALVLPRTLGHVRPAFGLTLDYAHRPLVISRPGRDPDSAPVEHRLLGHVTAALGLGSRFELFVRAPVLLVQRGDAQNAGIISAGLPTASAFGTLFAGAGLRLLGDDDGPLSLGVTGWVEAPTGSEDSLTGDDGVGAGGLLSGAANTHVLSFAVNVGYRYRPKQDYGSSRLGSELLLGAGAYARAGEHVTLLSELNGAIYLRDWGEVTTESSPFEVLLGLRIATPIDLSLTGAAGLGLTHAIGVPDVRGILQFAYPSPRAPLRASDVDHDGIPDDRDHCPERPEDKDGFQDADGCPDLDNDKDGIADAKDRCVNEAEDLDGIEDDNGCPDLDNDQDGILDAKDQCPNAPEDNDGFQDGDGCPDFDNDKDGLLDLRDQCPLEPEDNDGFADEDGCPDFDNDKDGVIDGEDGCPTVPGPAETRGCPSAVRIDKAQIRILERIEFQTKRAEVRPESLGILDQVRAAFEANPQIKRVRIEGHTDSRGPTVSNAKLSQRRAEAVLAYLVREGIDQNRLEAKGWGEERPLVKNDNAANMQINRRVEFHIVDPAPTSPGGGQ